MNYGNRPFLLSLFFLFRLSSSCSDIIPPGLSNPPMTVSCLSQHGPSETRNSHTPEFSRATLRCPLVFAHLRLFSPTSSQLHAWPGVSPFPTPRRPRSL
ncbi:hypothetical protein GGS23DRAFT_135141 [Durotheca rogersii]|uniref:uncharacterized protein n=1 Tax=Durotheca rogersii TaxID=419775 RepID=UPI00221F9D94|nr:uncharacterized protein GGS23DRAFT_135141 [Durotheca rogersii]KAI5861853.1 hypothetical protein GGS23DRAFT_135141 [Durotheca rogersii]